MIWELITIEKRVLLLGDHSAPYDMLQEYLKTDGINIDCVESITEAASAFAYYEYCLAILDIQQGWDSEIEAVQRMRIAKDALILIVSSDLGPENKVKLFHAGANVCIEKPVDIEVFVAQVNALIQLYDEQPVRNRNSDVSFGTRLIISFRFREVLFDGQKLILTRKEFELLYFFARHPLQVFSCEQLYTHIWKSDYAIYGDDTVKVHIGRLRKKINNAKTNCIQNVWGIGYKFVPPDWKTPNV